MVAAHWTEHRWRGAVPWYHLCYNCHRDTDFSSSATESFVYALLQVCFLQHDVCFPWFVSNEHPQRYTQPRKHIYRQRLIPPAAHWGGWQHPASPVPVGTCECFGWVEPERELSYLGNTSGPLVPLSVPTPWSCPDKPSSPGLQCSCECVKS